MDIKIKLYLVFVFFAFINSIIIYNLSQNYLYETIFTVNLLLLLFFMILWYDINYDKKDKKQLLDMSFMVIIIFLISNFINFFIININLEIMAYNILNILLGVSLLFIIIDIHHDNLVYNRVNNLIRNQSIKVKS